MSESPTIYVVLDIGKLNAPYLSVVMPAFSSEKYITKTIERVVLALEETGHTFELVVVNDGSPDGTWNALRDSARRDNRITAINLLKNYGQHSALMCGLRHSRGQYVVTIDDDLQNPPEEILRMLTHCVDGEHDLVIGEFTEPKKAKVRMLGTSVVNVIVTRVFNKDPDLKLSPFRVIRRDVVDRVCQSSNPTPYITGELLFSAASISNLVVRHDARIMGKSTYNPLKIFELLRRITFSYSTELLRIGCRIGILIAALSFLFSLMMTVRGFVVVGVAPGWTSMVTAVSFFSGMIILLLSMIGEYLAIVLLQTTGTPAYRESGIVKDGKPIDVERLNEVDGGFK